uniref:Uncharacterized protein n=1 Tax=Opuntia streptacantha TaxID=393608 RepID=A0A7C9AN27_OPUST
MELVHKINYIKRRLAKVCIVPEKKSLDDNILDSMQRCLLSLENSSPSILYPNNQLRMVTNPNGLVCLSQILNVTLTITLLQGSRLTQRRSTASTTNQTADKAHPQQL